MLIELLMAMFILALGLSAVAAIFPVATYLQKQTFNDLISQQLERNVEAIINAPGISDDITAALSGMDQTSRKVSGDDTDTITGAAGPLPLAVRCYPTADPYADTPKADPTVLTNRDFYWVPLFQDSNADSSGRTWVAYVFILARQTNASYTTGSPINDSGNNPIPKVVQVSASGSGNTLTLPAGTGLQAGDKLLLDNGVTPTITDVDGSSYTVDQPVSNGIGNPSKAWYAPPPVGGQSSPTVAIKIIALGN